MLARPMTMTPCVPNNVVNRGVTNTFTYEYWGQTFNQHAIQIADNRTDSGCRYWNVNSSNGLTSTTTPATPTWITASTKGSWASSATAFDSLTKSNGYKWRVRIYNSTTYSASGWSDWQPFFTSASSSPATILTPQDGTTVGQRYVVLKWTTSISHSMIKVRLLYGGTEVYNQSFGYVLTVGSTGSFEIPYSLVNGLAYTVGISIKTNTGEWGLWSGESTALFVASYEKFASPEITLEENNGIVTVACVQPDNVPAITSQNLYRWSPQRRKYVLLASGLDPSFTYYDKSAPVNVEFWYQVLSVAASTGTSEMFNTQGMFISGENWVIASESTRIPVVVVAAGFSRAHVLDELEPMGRSYKVVARYESSSREGTLDIDVLQEEKEVILQTLADMAEDRVYIISPYGDTVAANLTDITIRDDIAGAAIVSVSFIEEVES